MRSPTGGQTSSTVHAWALVAALIAGLGVSIWVLQTPTPRSGSGTSDFFPGLRAGDTLAKLMGSGSPHPIGSPANEAVRNRLVALLEEAGLAPEIQSRFVCGDFRRYCGTVFNVVARIEGQTEQAILLNSHYDTQAATPGAADPMAGVAVLVEIARIYAAGPRPVRSLIFLFNDGEEAGLLGAAAFVEHHPWAGHVQAVINLDARGSGGPSFPAYTIGADRAVLEPFARRGGRAPGGSALRAISALLPNTNDLAVFERLDVPGVLFGFARHLRHYHTPRDDLVHLDQGSLQQQGTQALAVAQAFSAGTDTETGGRLTYASIGPLVLQWPEPASGRIALGLVVCLLLLLNELRRRNKVVIGEAIWGAVAFLAALPVIFFGCAVANALRKAVTPLSLTWVSEPGPTVLGFGAAAAMWLFAVVLLFRRRAQAMGLWVGTSICWCALAVAVSVAAPGFGYLFSLPVGAAVMSAVILLADKSNRTGRSGTVTVAWAVPVVVTMAVWLPHLSILLDLIGLGNMPPVAALFGLALTPATPLLLASRRPWLWPGTLLLVATVSLGIGARAPAFSTTYPQWGNLIYAANIEAQAAKWLYTGSPLPPSLAAQGFSKELEYALPWLASASGASKPAPAPTLPGPKIEVLDSHVDDEGRRHIRAHASSPREAPLLQLVFEAQAAPVEWRIDEVIVPPDQVARPLFRPGYEVVTIWTLTREGIDLDFVFDDEQPRTLWLADRSYGLPSGGEALTDARPATAVPVANGDVTLVSRRVSL